MRACMLHLSTPLLSPSLGWGLICPWLWTQSKREAQCLQPFKAEELKFYLKIKFCSHFGVNLAITFSVECPLLRQSICPYSDMKIIKPPCFIYLEFLQKIFNAPSNCLPLPNIFANYLKTCRLRCDTSFFPTLLSKVTLLSMTLKITPTWFSCTFKPHLPPHSLVSLFRCDVALALCSLLFPFPRSSAFIFPIAECKYHLNCSPYPSTPRWLCPYLCLLLHSTKFTEPLKSLA